MRQYDVVSIVPQLLIPDWSSDVTIGHDERLERRRKRGERRRQNQHRALAAVALVLLVGLAVGIALAATGGNGAPRRETPVVQHAGRVTVSAGSRAKQAAVGPPTSESPKQSITSTSSGVLEGRALRVPAPHIVAKSIPFGAKRRAEMADYAKRHYGMSTWRLEQPHVIVEHYTASTTFSSVYNTFSADVPDIELHELPGVCSHFVIDKDGTIYRLVPLTTMCRHTVGLNYTAIGIEHVGMSDQDILGNPRQLDASLRLTLWLMQRKEIQLRNVIGHNESLTSPWHKELYAPWKCQTHGDWNRTDMNLYRAKLRRLARLSGVVIGPPAIRVTPQC